MPIFLEILFATKNPLIFFWFFLARQVSKIGRCTIVRTAIFPCRNGVTLPIIFEGMERVFASNFVLKNQGARALLSILFFISGDFFPSGKWKPKFRKIFRPFFYPYLCCRVSWIWNCLYYFFAGENTVCLINFKYF